MKNIPVFFLLLISPLVTHASECALSIDEGLVTILNQEGTLGSVNCRRNVLADLEIEVIFLCANGAQSPLFGAADRDQGDAWCGVQWIDCNGLVGGYQTLEPVSGKSASTDFAAIRNACSDLL